MDRERRLTYANTNKNRGGYSIGYDDGRADGYNSGHSDGYNQGYNSGYHPSNSVTYLTGGDGYDNAWNSTSYTATEAGVYCVVSVGSSCGAVNNSFAYASTTGTVLENIRAGNQNPDYEGYNKISYQIIIAYLQVGQSVSGAARGPNNYGRSLVVTYRLK